MMGVNSSTRLFFPAVLVDRYCNRFSQEYNSGWFLVKLAAVFRLGGKGSFSLMLGQCALAARCTFWALQGNLFEPLEGTILGGVNWLDRPSTKPIFSTFIPISETG